MYQPLIIHVGLNIQENIETTDNKNIIEETPEEFIRLCERWLEAAIGFITIDKLTEEVLDKANRYSISKDKTREILETLLKRRGLSDRHIRRVLPKELKRDWTSPIVTNDSKTDIMSELPKPRQEIKFEDVNVKIADLKPDNDYPIDYKAIVDKTPPLYEAIIKKIEAEGFDFSKPCEIWKDTCENIAEELTKIPNKQIVVFFQYAS